MATKISRATKARAAKAMQRPAPGNDTLFRWLVESIGDYAIITLDTKGMVTTWNAGAERIKGYRAEEIIGQHYSCFSPRIRLTLALQSGNSRSPPRKVVPRMRVGVSAKMAPAIGRM